MVKLKINKRTKHVVVVAVLSLVVIGAAITARAYTSAANAGVSLDLKGTVEISKVEASTQVDGVIVTSYVKEGLKVAPGQLLFKLNNDSIIAEVYRAEADLAVSTALKEKLAVGVTPEQLQQLQIAVQTAEVTYKSAQTAVDSLVPALKETSGANNVNHEKLMQQIKQLEADLYNSKERLEQVNVNQADEHAAHQASQNTTPSTQAVSPSANANAMAGEGMEDGMAIHFQTAEMIDQLNILLKQSMEIQGRLSMADSKISEAKLKNEVAQLESQLQLAGMNLDLAKARLAEALKGPGSVELAEAHAKVQQSKVDLLLAQQKQSGLEVRSFVDGFVDKVLKKPGEVVKVGDSLATLLKPQDTWVVATMSAAERPSWLEKAIIDIKLKTKNNQAITIPGRLEKISALNSENPQAGDLQLKIRIANPKGEIIVGAEANITLIKAK